MDKIYHVVDNWDGGDLRSLAALMGENDAIETFCAKWPEADAALAAYHVHLVHLYATREEADTHAAVWGGQVLEIDADQVYDLKMDDLEFEHPVARIVPRTAVVRS